MSIRSSIKRITKGFMSYVKMKSTGNSTQGQQPSTHSMNWHVRPYSTSFTLHLV
uniref:Uncharacterized protein n=1 Tax=Arundo donax TaxID=35708 RepID=A0A0A9C181_ARUDO